MDKELLKKRAGEKAAEWIEEGMLVGLGTGSTVFYFIEKLIQLCKKGLNITVVSSSSRSFEQAKQGGIPTANMNEVTQIDLTVDGADELDNQKRMIKGGGGALLREKILAITSKEMVVIIDESKIVEKLGQHPLPVEILPFGHNATIDKIRLLGYRGEIRTLIGKQLYQTDNGNYIYDIHFQEARDHPEEDHDKLIRIPGVLETGFFFNLAGRILVGEINGEVREID